MAELIFVCTGNTCRSPMAEALAKDLFEQLGIDIEVIGRGLSVGEPRPANPRAIQVMRDDYKIDIENHVAQQLLPEEIDAAKLVVVMTQAHKNYLALIHPTSQKKVKTIHEVVDKCKDVRDPIGMELIVYKKCAEELKKCVEAIAGRIVRGQIAELK